MAEDQIIADYYGVPVEHVEGLKPALATARREGFRAGEESMMQALRKKANDEARGKVSVEAWEQQRAFHVELWLDERASEAIPSDDGGEHALR